MQSRYTAVNMRDRPVPCAKKNSHQHLENTMVPAIMSLWNQGQWIHLAINNFISKANICVCSGSLCSLRMNCSTIVHRRRSAVCEGHTLWKKFATDKTGGVLFQGLTQEPMIRFPNFLINAVGFSVWEGKSLGFHGVSYKRLLKARL